MKLFLIAACLCRCSKHYVEYLGKVVIQQDIDPAPIFDVEELEAVVKKSGKTLPSRYGVTPDVWKDEVLNVNTQFPQFLQFVPLFLDPA